MVQQKTVFTSTTPNNAEVTTQALAQNPLSDPTLDPQDPQEHKAVIDHTQKLESLVKRSDHILLKISTVFPFKFFPDDLIVDGTKVTVIRRNFFSSGTMQSSLIAAIKDVTVESSLYFATLKIMPEAVQEQWVTIEFLKKSEAIRARDVILGLMAAIREGVDLSKVQTPNLVEKVETIGTAL